MIVPFDSARAGEESIVFTCALGDEYGWVTDPEWFDDIDEPVTVKRQQWQLICEHEVTFHPRHELCPRCGGEGTHPLSDAISCATCHGDGRHPLAGQMEVRP